MVYLQIKDAAENLAKDYVTLKTIGCIQFQNMTVTVYCNPDPNSKLAVSVNLRSIDEKFEGYGDVENQALCLHNFFKNCIQSWTRKMQACRR